MYATFLNGVTVCPVRRLTVGQRVDLESDRYADPGAFSNCSEHPEFQFEFEVVAVITAETDGCYRVDFESGFSCGFPPSHCVDVDGEQEA